jgi:hypothetical protein
LTVGFVTEEFATVSSDRIKKQRADERRRCSVDRKLPSKREELEGDNR